MVFARFLQARPCFCFFNHFGYSSLLSVSTNRRMWIACFWLTFAKKKLNSLLAACFLVVIRRSFHSLILSLSLSFPCAVAFWFFILSTFGILFMCMAWYSTHSFLCSFPSYSTREIQLNFQWFDCRNSLKLLLLTFAVNNCWTKSNVKKPVKYRT